MNYTERIIGMIMKPDATTRDIIDNPRLEEGLLIVGIYMILGIILEYAALSRVKYVGSAGGINASTMATIMMIMGIVMAIATILIGWLVVTGACHVLSMFFGGEGKFSPNMLTVIGYTCIPLIVFTLISIVVAFMLPTTTVDLGQASQTAKVAKDTLGNPLQLLSNYVLPVLGGIWTAFMTLYAVKNGEKLSMNNALVVVGVLFILDLAMIFSSFIIAMLI